MIRNKEPINQENNTIADSNQTGNLEVSRRARSIRFGLLAGWLILGLAVASLIVALTWTGNLVRYPGVERQAAGSLSQQST